MSCGSSGYCQFTFPEGPPLTDNSVSHLKAKYLFLPYGTLLSEGEVVRIWTENGQTSVVGIEKRITLSFLASGVSVLNSDIHVPWSLVAFDSDLDEADILGWYQHPLFNPATESVVLVFQHFIEPSSQRWISVLKSKWLAWLYKMRTL